MSEQTFIKGLYLVATPIGNLGDISARAVEVLSQADIIACEDTRVSQKLLSYLGIKGKLIPYHEHNWEKTLPLLMEKLQAGEMVAQISDAGTPLVSDPGYRLVQECIDKGIYFTAIPGASAVLTALQLSGLPCHRWLFEGFLPAKQSAKEKELAELSMIPATMIFYESPNRLSDTLATMKKILGDRKAAVARELTKKFEQTIRGTFSELLAYYEENGQPKGEIVIVVEQGEQKQPEIDVAEELRRALETMRVKEAAAFVAEKTGLSKKELYQQALILKDE